MQFKSIFGLLSAAVIMIGLNPALSSAQNAEGNRIIKAFDQKFNALDSLIYHTTTSPRQLVDNGTADNFGRRTSSTISAGLDSALKANTAAKINEGNGKTGLQLTGQAYYRVAGNGGYEDETGEGHYRAKVQAELRWYLLQSSLFGRDGRRKVAEIEEEIARAGYEKERIDISEFLLKDQITNYYDSLLAGVLNHRIDLLNLLDEAQQYMLGNENISSDELVKVLNDRMEAQRKLSEIEREYPAAVTLDGIDATIVRIDSAALVNHVAASQGDMKILRLRMDLLEQKEKNVKWWNNLNVAPFIRYAQYLRTGLPNSYNVDAGITFTIPLSNEYKRRRQTMQTERIVLENEQERLTRRVADKTALVVAEVGRLNRASESELKRIIELKKYIRMRTDAYRKVKGEHNRLARAREYALYIASLERLIDYQYRRDCLVANLQSLLPDETILRFCSFTPLREAEFTLTGTHF